MTSSAAYSAGYEMHKILNAAPVPPRPAQRDAQPPIPARARVVWEHDGQEILDALAIGWTSRHIWIQLRDPRPRFVGVWLPARDVRRREDQRST
ncbi:hypothetical protein [Sanguibacter suaedae]|uniref:Uncharacterized protein n=1 Tax=Sanguibacter suaedae TaxID=2795737 RepID=A0A934IDE3_9MICO|nr:hypothetical protein [Sanguibacter suaedae]MBI9114879.1 hypothetical protein [Sanguibacter suaedae]